MIGSPITSDVPQPMEWERQKERAMRLCLHFNRDKSISIMNAMFRSKQMKMRRFAFFMFCLHSF